MATDDPTSEDLELMMPNGRHKDVALDELPSPYLKWVAENFATQSRPDTLARDKKLCEAADRIYRWRSKHGEHFT